MKKTIYYSSYPIVDNLLLYKEHGEIPYYFSKLFGYNAIIDDYNDEMPKSQFRSVQLLPSPNRFRSLRKLLNIFLHAKEIDILYVILIHPDTMFKMLAYRLGGGKGKIYLKLDLGLYEKNGKDLLVWKNMNFFLKTVHLLFKKLPDIYTVETQNGFRRLTNTYYNDLIAKKKLYLLPNGFDPESLDEIGIIPVKIQEKEKIILTVGRIGLFQKNTELLLSVLADVELKDWKVYIVGPIEESFLQVIQDYYVQYPDKKQSILFTGMISQKEKYNIYNKARVFILTSRHESYAFVLAEAVYMNNYIISTNVGIASELLEYTSGFVTDSHCKSPFVKELQRIINLSDGDLNELTKDGEKKEITWEWILNNNMGIQSLLNE